MPVANCTGRYWHKAHNKYQLSRPQGGSTSELEFSYSIWGFAFLSLISIKDLHPKTGVPWRQNYRGKGVGSSPVLPLDPCQGRSFLINSAMWTIQPNTCCHSWASCNHCCLKSVCFLFLLTTAIFLSPCVEMFLFWLGSKFKNMADNNHIILRETSMWQWSQIILRWP